MVASSTMKAVCRKSTTGFEKKKAKLTKEFTQNLAMLVPEDRVVAKEKANSMCNNIRCVIKLSFLFGFFSLCSELLR